MDRSEELREALLNLEEARKREAQQHQLAEALLLGLRALVFTQDPDDLFQRLFEVMKKPLDFEEAFVLTMDKEGLLRPQATSNELFAKTVWKPKSMFRRVIEGQTVTAFDTRPIDEWRSQPEIVRNSVRSALHFSIHPSEQKTLFICTHSSRGHFSRDHIVLARRFSMLAIQALQKLETEKELFDIKKELDIKEKLAGLSQKLIESEKRYRALFDLSPYGIITIDPATKKFNYANPRFCEMLNSMFKERWHNIFYGCKCLDNLYRWQKIYNMLLSRHHR